MRGDLEILVMQDSIFKDRWFWSSFFAGGMVLSLTLWFGFGMDQSICAYIAWVWKTYQLPPYVGVWDLSFPGIFIIYRLPVQFFGASILSVRVFDFLVQLSCLAMLFYISRKLSGSGVAGFFTSIFYSLLYYGLGQTDTAQRESFIFWLLLAAITAAFSMRNRALLRAALVGLLAGFCFLIKPFYGLCWPVFGVLFLAQGLKKKSRSVWLELFVFGAFCLLPSLLAVLYYWRIGHLQDLIEQTLWFNFVIYGIGRKQAYGPGMLLVRLLRHNYLKRPLLLVLGLAGILLTALIRDRRKQPALFWTLLSMLLMGVVVYLIQKKFFPFHLFIFLGFLTVFAGLATAFIGGKIRGSTPRLRGKALSGGFYFAAVAGMVLFLGPAPVSFALNHAFRNFESAYQQGSGFVTDPHQATDQYLAAEFLKPRLRPDDEIEFFGPYPLIQFLLQRKLPSRYACVQHFLFVPADGNITPQQMQWMREYSDSIITLRPRFFLVTDSFPGAKNKFMNLSSRSLKQALNEQFPELKFFLGQNYRLIATIRSIEVYELAR